MSKDKDKDKKNLPIRTLHDFLIEISNEWSGFRTGSLLSIITTIVLFILFIPRFFIITLRRGGPLDTLLVIGIIVALLYSIYLSYRQHKFYQRWEKRIALLIHIEEELLGEES